MNFSSLLLILLDTCICHSLTILYFYWWQLIHIFWLITDLRMLVSRCTLKIVYNFLEQHGLVQLYFLSNDDLSVLMNLSEILRRLSLCGQHLWKLLVFFQAKCQTCWKECLKMALGGFWWNTIWQLSSLIEIY